MNNLNKNEKIGVSIALVVVVFFFIIGPSIIGPLAGVFTESETRERSSEIVDTSTDTIQVSIVDTKVGEGREAKNGDRVTVHYVGKLEDGSVFDSSLDRGSPFSFTLGAGEVIEGWEQGILRLKIGGERTLTIPPELGYGEQGIGPIPGGATLIFEVLLVDIES